MTPEFFDVAGLPFPCRISALRFDPPQPMISRGVVVAVHGLTRQKHDFDDMAHYLAGAGYTVYCLDVPGRGGSSWLPTPHDYTLLTYAKVLAALVDQQGWASVHWVGSSMGGLIALTLPEIQRQDLLASLTLIDITHCPNRDACARIAAYMPDTLPIFQDVDDYEALVRQYLPLGTVSDDVWRRFAVHQLTPLHGVYTSHYDPQLVPEAKKGLAEGVDLQEGLRALTCPVSLVAGELSDLCGKAEIDQLLAIKPQMPVFICAGAGHIPALADTASNSFIAQFIHGSTMRCAQPIPGTGPSV